jgi:phosphoribosylaminoimidazolecarboxamide formyltransferase / IMP cyclohydrolase
VTRIQRAIISVSDKSGLVELARYLHENQVQILSTGGTATALRNSGVAATEVSDYTGFPEIMDGRVKTLHPRIHGGILSIRDNPAHQAQAAAQQIGPIDLVVVNLYPFRQTAAREGVSFEEVVEQIDIGGPSLVRAAAKNHAWVAVVTDPLDYGWILQELKDHNCSLGPATRFRLAQKAFAHTGAYDSAIASWLADRTWSPEGPVQVSGGLPALAVLPLEKVKDLRYGENPHQRGALYRTSSLSGEGVTGAEFLHGKELSYNNLLDSDAAWNLALEFDRPAAAVIKHMNPSGAAQADTLKEAYVLARDCDPVSAFGSVVALNRTVDRQTAEEINSTFVEVVLAPEFDGEALEILRQKKNLRLLRVKPGLPPPLEHRQVGAGFIVQDKDLRRVGPDDLKTVTRRAPTPAELDALLFGWRVVKHVKSNAIVYCNANRTLGIGAGQMSRVDSVKWGAQRAVLDLKGSVLASDAFFPFADGVLAAAEHGITAVIQPGGSVRDADVIEAANSCDIAMVFTGIRHFKH